MASFTLNRVDKEHHGEKWVFETDGRFARLAQPDGQTVETFTPDQGFDAFLKISGLGGGGGAYLFWGAILIGAVFLYQSYYYYAEARRLQKLHSET